MRLKHAAALLACLAFFCQPARADGQSGRQQTRERGPGSAVKATAENHGLPSGPGENERAGWENGRPPGWSQGNKAGWHGAATPPGLAREEGEWYDTSPPQTSWVRRQTTRFGGAVARLRDRVRNAF
jgi:hypothetical protein